MASALDTNILIYAHMKDYPEHQQAYAFLQEFLGRSDPYYIGWQVCYEYIRLVTHPKVHRIPLTVREAIEDLRPYLCDPRCRILVETSEHLAVFETIMQTLPDAKGNFIHDCHYAALLKEHAVDQIVTADSDFRKFDFLKVINPLL